MKYKIDSNITENGGKKVTHTTRIQSNRISISRCSIRSTVWAVSYRMNE